MCLEPGQHFQGNFNQYTLYNNTKKGKLLSSADRHILNHWLFVN